MSFSNGMFIYIQHVSGPTIYRVKLVFTIQKGRNIAWFLLLCHVTLMCFSEGSLTVIPQPDPHPPLRVILISSPCPRSLIFPPISSPIHSRLP